MKHKGNVDNALLRLYYLTMVDYPVNWLEKNFQSIVSQMSKVRDIDHCYPIFFPELAMRLKEKNKSVAKYLKKHPVKSSPDIEGNKFTLIATTSLINEVWERIKEKVKQKDDKVIDTLLRLKILETPEKLPFETIKNALFQRVFTFKLLPHQNLKGTNALIMLSLVYFIETGRIGQRIKDGSKKMKEVALFYACESSKSAVISLQEVWELINYVMGTDVKLKIKCEL